LEQDKIDVAGATPVSGASSASLKPVRRGAPLWAQLLLSLIVIVVAAGIAGVLLPTANTMLARIGVSLPLLTAPAADASAAPAAGQGQNRQASQAQASGAPAGQRTGGQTGGQAGGGQGGQFAGRSSGRVSVVVAVLAKTGIINNKLTAIGESSAINSVTINTASGGTLVAVNVKPGDQVAAGAKLATLDSDTQQNAVDKAKLTLNDADSTLSRTQSLAKTNSVPTSQLDSAQLADDSARLALQAAQITLDQRTITTPAAGTVGLIQVSPGNLINAQSIVTTIEDSSEILVNFWVPERYTSQMQVGMQVAAESSALPGKTFTGTITAIDNRIDPASRTLQVQGTIPNPDGVIKSGMSFSVDMTFPGETFPSVDPLSIQWSNQGAYVWKVVDTKVQKGMVEIIQRNTDGVLVKGDVKPGDNVVTQGVLQLTDGATVRLLDNGSQASLDTGAAGASSGAAQPAGATSPAGGGTGQNKRRQSSDQPASAAASMASSAAGG
jgi:RND family efflux transporter MFP subunit